MTDRMMTVSLEALAGCGEDSFAVRKEDAVALLCVADGCGGLGSRRYPALDNHTGAYAASRLATHVLSEWARNCSVPLTREAGEHMCRELGERLDHHFSSFAEERCRTEGIRIVGSMQRRLPTTLCAAIADEKAAAFLWVGDSRGYVLDTDGLHQCTRDDLKGGADPFENLYLDRPLSAYLSADMKANLHFRRVSLDKPSLVIVATDGAYNALPTPMEFEMLLLDALKAAKSWDSFERKLESAVKKNMQDDATLLVCTSETVDFEGLKTALLPRREKLQKQYITPVRRKKGDVAFARARWQSYRASYDWTEGERHG